MFAPYEAFKRMDRYTTGQLDEDDLKHFCADNGVNCTYDDAARVIAAYDEDANGRLNFTEFHNLVLPATDLSARQHALNRDRSLHAVRRSVLAAEVETKLARLLASEIDFQRQVDRQKYELEGRFDFTCSAAFELLDTRVPLNKVDRHEIAEFIELYSRPVDDYLLDAII